MAIWITILTGQSEIWPFFNELWADFDENFRIALQWYKKERIKFCGDVNTMLTLQIANLGITICFVGDVQSLSVLVSKETQQRFNLIHLHIIHTFTMNMHCYFYWFLNPVQWSCVFDHLWINSLYPGLLVQCKYCLILCDPALLLRTLLKQEVTVPLQSPNIVLL